jgi:hypothetical protein
MRLVIWQMAAPKMRGSLRSRPPLEVLGNSELLGFNFKDHFGVIWMDGASNNVLAGEMLESLHGLPEYPWMCVEWCTPHLANVVLGLVSEIIAEGQDLFEWFMNYHAQHAMFVAQSDLYYGGEGKGRTLVGGADTRFGKHFSVLVRMLVEKPVLEAAVVSKPVLEKTTTILVKSPKKNKKNKKQRKSKRAKKK